METKGSQPQTSSNEGQGHLHHCTRQSDLCHRGSSWLIHLQVEVEVEGEVRGVRGDQRDVGTFWAAGGREQTILFLGPSHLIKPKSGVVLRSQYLGKVANWLPHHMVQGLLTFHLSGGPMP